MNTVDVDCIGRGGFFPIDGSGELHILRVSFGKRLAVEVGGSLGFVYVLFLRVFVLYVAEVLK